MQQDDKKTDDVSDKRECDGSNRFHIDVRPNEDGHTIDDVLWGVLLMKLNLLLEAEGFDYLGAYLEEYD